MDDLTMPVNTLVQASSTCGTIEGDDDDFRSTVSQLPPIPHRSEYIQNEPVCLGEIRFGVHDQNRPPTAPSEAGSTNKPFSSALATYLSDRNEADKPSSPLDLAISAEGFIADYKILSTLGHIRSYLHASDPKIKMSYLLAIAENYQSGSMFSMVDNHLATNKNIESLFSWITKLFSGKDSESDSTDFQPQSLDPDWIEQLEFKADNLPYDPLLDIEEQTPETKSFLLEMEKHMPILRPVLGGILFFACALGFHKLLELDWIADTSKSVIELSNLIRAKKVVKDEIETGADNLLSMLYSAMGETYYTPKQRTVQAFANRIEKLRIRLQSYVNRTKTDAMGLVRDETLAGLSKEMNSIRHELTQISSHESSLFNFNTKLIGMSQNLAVLEDRRVALVRGGTKQQPVRLWLYGLPNVGKTMLAGRIGRMLTNGGSVYTRTAQDKYWSGYIGQSVAIFDDILQNKESEDASEWMQHATENCTDTIQAAIDAKGTPMTSTYLIATSNFPYIDSHKGITSKEAFDRRRDFLVYVTIPGLREYMNANGSSPPTSWYKSRSYKLHLYQPLAPHFGITSNFVDDPSPQTQGYIGTVTLDELCYMMQEMEHQNAEKFRQVLLERKLPEGLITIPAYPIAFDERKFDVSKIFDPITKQKNYELDSPGSTIIPLPADIPAMAGCSQDSELEFIGMALNPVPVKKFTDVRKRAIVLAGPPGIGKSFLWKQFFESNGLQPVRVDAQYLRANPDWLERLNGHNGYVFFDDFSICQETLEAFKICIEQNDRNDFPCRGLIGTCNPGVMNATDIGIVYRRSCVVTLGLTTTASWAAYLKGQSIEDYLNGKDTAQRFACISHEVSDRTLALWRLDGFPVEIARYFECGVEKSTSQITFAPFVIPKPTNYDVLVNIPDEHVASIKEMAAFMSRASIYERRDGVFVKLGPTEMLKAFQNLKPFFFTKAYGDFEKFSQIFNQEQHPPLIPQHVLVNQGGRFMGFCAVENQTVCYQVDFEKSGSPVICRDDVIFMDGKRLTFPPGNENYEKVIRKAFSEEIVEVAPIATGAQEILHTLRQTSPAYNFLVHALGFAPLILKGLAMSCFLSDMSPPEKFVEERSRRKKRDRKRAQSSSDSDSESSLYEEKARVIRKPRAQPSPTAGGSDQENNDNKHRKENYRLEKSRVQRQQRPQPTTQAGGSDQERNDDKKKREQYRMEKSRVQRTPRPQPPKRDNGSDAENNDNKTRSQRFQTEAYDPQLRPKRNVIVLESKAFADGMLLYNAKEDYIGFSFNDLIVYAAEGRNLSWQIMSVFKNSDWSVVDVQDIKRVFTKQGNFKVMPKSLSGEEQNIMAMIGTKFDLSEYKDVDFDSVFAFSFVTGYPYSILQHEFAYDVLPILFKQGGRARLPLNLRMHLKKNRDDVLKACSTELDMQGMMDPQFLEQAHRACDSVVSIEHEGNHVVFGMGIGKNKILTVAHITDLAEYQIQRNGITWNIVLETVNKKHDLAVYVVNDKRFESFPTISHLFVDKEKLLSSLSAGTTGIPIGLVIPPRKEQKFVSIQYGTSDATLSNRMVEVKGRHITYSGTLGDFMSTGFTKRGDCGSLLCIQDKTFTGKILGLHRAGNTGKSMAVVVTRQWVDDILSDSQQITIFEPESDSVTDMKLHSELAIRTNPTVCAKTGLLRVGQLSRHIYHPTTTRIHRTGITIPGYDGYEPSLMSTADPRGEGFDPLYDGLTRYGKTYKTIPLDMLELKEAFYEIGWEIVSLLKRRGQNVRVFSATEAINTPPHLEYPNAAPIDRSGSAGFPYVWKTGMTTKGDYLYLNAKTGKHQFKSEGQFIASKINEIVVDAKNGKEHLMPTIAYVKDESLKLKKIHEPSTRKSRLFFSCPFPYLIAFRMYNAAALNRIMDNYTDLPIKVGISSTFTDWHTLGMQLKRVGENGFCSDMANFDSSIPKEFIECCGDVMNMIYAHCSARGEDPVEGNKVRDILSGAVEGAYVCARRDLFKLTQAQVSGNPATAVWNSFCVWALYYLVWRRLAKIHAPDLQSYKCFRQNVSLAIYGDDNVCTVAQHCTWFNFNSFQRESAKFGFSVTDIAKTGGVVPDFQPLTDMEFLKRTFSQIQGRITGPLALTSIAKSLQWIRDSAYKIDNDTLSRGWPIAQNREIINQSIDAMWCELALHGEATYYEWINIILPQASSNSLTISPPSWKEAMAQKGYNVYSSM